MGQERNEHKRKFKFGDTRITTHIPEADPVFQGVMKAAEILGGNFPEHVGQIIIKSEEVKDPKKEYILTDDGEKETIEYYVQGDCVRSDNGFSVIRIFAGSIKKVLESYLVKSGAMETTLHEIGHSERNMFDKNGFLIDSVRSNKHEEDCAEKFVEQARVKFQERQNKKQASQPRKTWKQVLESKRSTSTE